jgi:hypothetical protein
MNLIVKDDNMYTITELLTGKWYCELMVQDGYERWHENTREEAVQQMIKGARILNNSYIREDDITFQQQRPKPLISTHSISVEDDQLLKDIKGGRQIVLPFDHYFFQYRITKEEGEMLVKIREGDLVVTKGDQG